MIAGTAMAWYRAVTDGRVWDRQLDTPRFRKAFVTLMKNRRQWPSPADFMDAMPPREQLALTKQPITAAPESPEMKRRFDEIGRLLRMH